MRKVSTRRVPVMTGTERTRLAFLTSTHVVDDLYQGAVPALLPFLAIERHYSYTGLTGITLAATFLASRRSDLLLRPGATELPRWLGVPRVTWAGGLTTVLALFTIVEVLVHSSVYGKLSAESITTLVIVLGAGPVIYLIASSLRRRNNQIDIGMSMRELPPE